MKVKTVPTASERSRKTRRSTTDGLAVVSSRQMKPARARTSRSWQSFTSLLPARSSLPQSRAIDVVVARVPGDPAFAQQDGLGGLVAHARALGEGGRDRAGVLDLDHGEDGAVPLGMIGGEALELGPGHARDRAGQAVLEDPDLPVLGSPEQLVEPGKALDLLNIRHRSLPRNVVGCCEVYQLFWRRISPCSDDRRRYSLLSS